MRVVLYAEGAGEEGIADRMAPAPGTPLSEGWLGPAHELIRRCLLESQQVGSVAFEAPLRVGARHARGSTLKVCSKLRRLLTWPHPEMAPELAVVLVDADGSHQVHSELRSCLGKRPPIRLPVAIRVAVQEFEAWLLADEPCVRAVAERELPPQPDPESLPPRASKQQLSEALSHLEKPKRVEARRKIAADCDLDELQRRCPSFERFRKELRQVAS